MSPSLVRSLTFWGLIGGHSFNGRLLEEAQFLGIFIGVPVDKFLVNLFYSSAKMIKNTCWAQVPTILNAFIFGLKKLQWLADLDNAFSLSTGTAKNPADVRLIMH
ncbi:hypothetical protein NC652_013010 [Populus alba x Populus x berolinensis]|nr:hypothetical protein NC652_013010 [Populus alba x Populus x berolinensis]